MPPHTPNSTLVVQGVGAALGDDGAVPADDGGLALGRAAHEKLVGVRLPAARLEKPTRSWPRPQLPGATAWTWGVAPVLCVAGSVTDTSDPFASGLHNTVEV